MQVRTGRTSGVTSKCNRLSCLYQLVYINQLFRQVSVHCFQTVIMANNDIFSISAAPLILDDTHLAIKSCANGIAYIHLDIQAIVRSSSARTVTEYISDTGMFSRHTETFQIKCITFRHNSVAISLHQFIVPAWIQIQSRIQSLFRTNLFLQSQ